MTIWYKDEYILGWSSRYIHFFFWLILKDIKTLLQETPFLKSFMVPGLCFWHMMEKSAPDGPQVSDTQPDVLMETPFPSWILPSEITDMLTPHLHALQVGPGLQGLFFPPTVSVISFYF